MAPLHPVDPFGSHRSHRPRPGSHPYYIPTADSFGAHRLPLAPHSDPFASSEHNFNTPSSSEHSFSNTFNNGNFGNFGNDYFDSHSFDSNFNSFDDSNFDSTGYHTSAVPDVAVFPSSPIDEGVDAFTHATSQLDEEGAEAEAEQNPFHRMLAQFDGPARTGINPKGDLSLDGGINPYRRVLARPQPHYLTKRNTLPTQQIPLPLAPLAPVSSPTEEPAELAGGTINRSDMKLGVGNNPVHIIVWILAGIVVLQGVLWVVWCVMVNLRAAKARARGRRGMVRIQDVEGDEEGGLAGAGAGAVMGMGKERREAGPDVGEVE